MKKMTALLLSLMLGASVMLSACGDGGGNTEPPQDTADADNRTEDGGKPSGDLITVTKASESTASVGTTQLFALEELDIASPDGRITAHFWLDSGDGMYYSVQAGDEEVITPSKLGMALKACNFSTGITRITAQGSLVRIQESYETCLTVALADVSCVDDCAEREIYIEKEDAGLTLVVRAYNDGFAFRYANVDCGSDGQVSVISEASQVNLPEGTTTFAGGYSATYEYEYTKRSYEQLKSHSGVFNTPLTAETQSHWLLLSESDVYANNISYCKSVLETRGQNAALNWRFGFRRDPAKEVNDDLSSPGHIRIDELETVNGFTTPWRVAIIADDLNGLINSPVIDSLCPAMDRELFADTSWIKPGKVSWSWWSGGDQHNYDIQVQHVDFSAKYGWEYCCLDAGWPSFENRIEGLCSYAKERNVGIILWVNYLKLKTPEDIEKLFSKWSKWGVAGVKTDYFESDDIEVLESMRNVAEIAAKYKLMVYYHGCINPCGETRTYPNIMSSEAVLGEEYRKWSTAPTPQNCLMYPFTRNITGSMDYTPSCIAITKTGESAGFSLAKSVVYESALQHFASSAYSFPSYPGLPFLSRIPTAWKDTKLIDGYPGEHITIVRTDGDDYYLGAMTLQARSVDVPLDFLGGGNYNAYLYGDDADGKLVLEERVVSAKDTLHLELSAIGGAAVLFTKDIVDTAVEVSSDEREGFAYYECEDGVMSGEARVADSAACSGGRKAGYVGNGGDNTVTLTVEAAEAGTYEFLLYYCTGEPRNLMITIGEQTYELTGLTGQGYDLPVEKELEVRLEKGSNNIVFGCANGYAPDLDRIGIGKSK